MQARSRYTTAEHVLKPYCWAAVLALGLTACGGSGSSGQDAPVAQACTETGPYACQSGESEPLYAFQWALRYAGNYFTTHSDAGAYGGGMDLNIEPVHKLGYKGQGVNVLVLDTGVDFTNEDLRDNADLGMSWNYANGSPNTTPDDKNALSNHGTMVAGVIGAAQNGKGIMGIAPRATLGAATVSGNDFNREVLEIFGGAPWSRKVHLVSASMYWSNGVAERYSLSDTPYLQANRNMRAYRDGKGIVYVKSAGNSFTSSCPGDLAGHYDCMGAHMHAENLEPNTLVVAALNAKGQASGYSTAGSLLWVTGMGGESGRRGAYGEQSGLTTAELAQGFTGDGPKIYTTDFPGCDVGEATSDVATAFERGLTERVPGVRDNPQCAYATMGGTSAAAPTISGVAALVLSANPQLTWRDVREILKLSARKVDDGYERRIRNDYSRGQTFRFDKPYNARFDLRTNSLSADVGNAADLAPGAVRIPLELGWQKNAAGNDYANWYGFGVPDAERAVTLALAYARDPKRSQPSLQAIPDFTLVNALQGFRYQEMRLIGEFTGGDQTVDEFQVLMDGSDVCLGSVGIVVESPAGTKSILKMPLDHLGQEQVKEFAHYGLGSYAFYGERARGQWKVYAAASNPVRYPSEGGMTASCSAAPADGMFAPQATLSVYARVIAQ